MPRVDHVEEDVRGVGAVREVADLVDDEEAHLGVIAEAILESATTNMTLSTLARLSDGLKLDAEELLRRPRRRPRPLPP